MPSYEHCFTAAVTCVAATPRTAFFFWVHCNSATTSGRLQCNNVVGGFTVLGGRYAVSPASLMHHVYSKTFTTCARAPSHLPGWLDCLCPQLFPCWLEHGAAAMPPPHILFPSGWSCRAAAVRHGHIPCARVPHPFAHATTTRDVGRRSALLPRFRKRRGRLYATFPFLDELASTPHTTPPTWVARRGL